MNAPAPQRRFEISPLFWLWLPPLMIVLVYAVRLWKIWFYQYFIESELGIVELGTPMLLLPGLWAGIQIWRHRRALPRAWLAAWLALVSVGGFYFAGEEISWGQQLFGWSTPVEISAINDQHETNFHNISSWFDQKPRLALELWVIVGGLLLPAWRALRGIRFGPDDWQYWFWPGIVCVPAAALAEAIKLPEYVKDLFGLPPFSIEVRYSEIQEFYFALFLGLYLLSCWLRLRPRARAAGPG